MSDADSKSSAWSIAAMAWCGIVFIASTVLLVLTWNVEAVFLSDYTGEALNWIQVGRRQSIPVPLDFAFSNLTLVAFCSVVMILGVAAWRAPVLQCVAIFGCVPAAFAMFFATNLIMWFAGWLLAAFCAAIAIGAEDRLAAPLAARRFLTAGVFLDGVFLLLIGTFLSDFGSTEWAEPMQYDPMRIGPDVGQILAAENGRTLLAGIAFYLAVSVLARCGVFPFHGWTTELSAANWRTFAIVRCGLFTLPALFLLAHYQSLISEASAENILLIRRLTRVLGVFTILVGAASSLMRTHHMSALNGVLTAFIGLCWVLSTHGDVRAIACLTMPVFVAAAIGMAVARSGVSTTSKSPTNVGELHLEAETRPAWIGTVPVTLLLLIFVYSIGRFDSLASFASPCCVVGGMVASLALVRLLFAPAKCDGQDPSPPVARCIVVGLLVAGVGLTAASISVRFTGLLVWTPDQRLFSALDAVLLPLALTIGWFLFHAPSDIPARIVRYLGPIARLAKQGFYVDDAVFFLLTMPLRGLAQAARLMDWLVVDNMVVGVPSRYPGWLAKVAAPLRQPTVGLSLLSTCVGLAVMLVIVVWLWS